MILYACTNTAGQEIAWGASPSLAMLSAARGMGCAIEDLRRDGYTVQPSTIVPLRGGQLAAAIARSLLARTPAQRRADRLHALRWRVGPLLAGGIVAALAAAWSLATGIHR